MVDIAQVVLASVKNAAMWFSGGENQYHTLNMCMHGDTPWIVITVLLDFAVASGYILIAKHWWRNERTMPPTPGRKALTSMRNIFIFCGLCGYMFIPIKMVYPAWRLYDLFMIFLVYFTWKYAWGAKDLKVLYNELGRTNQLEAELDKTKADMRKKSFFLNAISHDLRTPLNGMMLQATVAEMSLGTNDAETLRHALQQIKASANSTSHLLDSLLEYARLGMADEANTTSSFDLAQAVTTVIEQQRAAAGEKNIALVSNCPADLRVQTDQTKLERVLANLIGNAVKFTQAGGVRIEVDCAGADLEIHVIDTGVGIAAEDRERLFEEFFQVKNHERDRRKGFGLGLAISRRLARQLGGDINVESAIGRGMPVHCGPARRTRRWRNLPPTPFPEMPAHLPSQNKDVSRAARTVLLVEDDAVSACKL